MDYAVLEQNCTSERYSRSEAFVFAVDAIEMFVDGSYTCKIGLFIANLFRF